MCVPETRPRLNNSYPKLLKMYWRIRAFIHLLSCLPDKPHHAIEIDRNLIR